MIRFTHGNHKLTRGEVVFNLPASHSCPFAKDCRATADRRTGRITDGKQSKFRCYAASVEAAFPNARKLHWSNFEALKGKSRVAVVIHGTQPRRV